MFTSHRWLPSVLSAQPTHYPGPITTLTRPPFSANHLQHQSLKALFLCCALHSAVKSPYDNSARLHPSATLTSDTAPLHPCHHQRLCHPMKSPSQAPGRGHHLIRSSLCVRLLPAMNCFLPRPKRQSLTVMDNNCIFHRHSSFLHFQFLIYPD